jgi:diaminopimelate epimerase
MVKYYIDRGLTIPETRELFIETRTGIRRAEIVKQDGKIAKIKIGMGEPRFSSDDIPVDIVPDKESLVDIKSIMAYPINIDGRDLELNLVSVGNPHAVYFTQEPIEDFPLSQIGPKVEFHRIFPKGVNFEIARVVSSQHVDARVWERGVGETLACGTGACAISAAGQRRGYLDREVDIRLPGGTLGVQWDGSGEIFLSGPTGIVFSGEWPD